jgi:hypothetical protein
VAFVEMGMNVDQGRPDLAAAGVGAGNPVIAFFSRPFDARELAVFNQQVRLHYAFRIDRRRQRYAIGQQTGRHARVRKPIAARCGPDDVSESDRHLRHRGG